MDDKLRCTLIRLFYANGSSATATLRAYRRETGEKNPPCTESAIRKLIQKFENESAVSDLPRSGRPSASGDTITQIDEACGVLQSENAYGRCSVRELARYTGVAKSSVHDILRKKLYLKPYKPSFVQELHPTDFKSRLDFVKKATGELNNDFSNVFWTDEANFSLSGEASSICGAIWAAFNPHVTISKPLHSPKVTVWVGMNRKHISPPFFFEGNVNSESYLRMLKEHCVPFLKSKRIFGSSIFQQDGAPPHIARSVKEFLRSQFGEKIISRHFDFHWPARSPDMTPLDFWFWGYVKQEVYKVHLPDIESLKQRISEVTANIDRNMLARVIDSIPTRYDQLVKQNGSQIK